MQIFLAGPLHYRGREGEREKGGRPVGKESQALGIQSEKAPSIDMFVLQYLLMEGLLNLGQKAPLSDNFYKLTNPVDARD